MNVFSINQVVQIKENCTYEHLINKIGRILKKISDRWYKVRIEERNYILKLTDTMSHALWLHNYIIYIISSPATWSNFLTYVEQGNWNII